MRTARSLVGIQSASISSNGDQGNEDSKGSTVLTFLYTIKALTFEALEGGAVVCVRACVRACVRVHAIVYTYVCERACMRACACVHTGRDKLVSIL